jgi:sugar phosphate isomerase/epimerase
MYKNLNPFVLGISGRQGELLEIAMTYRFKGVDIDIREAVKRADISGIEATTRYILSAPIKIGGFELPVRWAGAEADFKADLAELPKLLNVATALGANRCYTTVLPTSDDLPFHDNFKFTALRLRELAAPLAERGIKLGLDFHAAEERRNNGGYQFICQADPLLMLIQTVNAENVGLMLDVWNWQLGGGTAEKLRALRGEQVVGVRLSDLPSDVEAANAKEEQRLIPGDGGQIDSAAYLSLLEELAYEGPVSIAAHPTPYKDLKREELVKKAAGALDTLWAAAGIDGTAKPVSAT